MADEPWDAIIVGQGLAGTTLAWCLIEAGQRVLVVDAEPPVTSSKIAAGLITPITGQRLTHSWRCDEFLPAAQRFYARIEERTGQTFFRARTAVRLFQSDEEREIWAQRRTRPEFQPYLVTPPSVPLLDPEIGDARGGGFEMRTAQLDVATYLSASRAAFAYQPMQLDWAGDVTIGAGELMVQGQRTRQLISCEGHAAARNPYFAAVPYKFAQGDILTVRLQRPIPPVCLHRGIWVAPTAAPDVFRIGATYDWVQQDQVPRAEARAEIERKLRAFFRVPYTVIAHQAAVRPIIETSKALMGLHPDHERLGYFNGLGSKGALHAPWFAQCFADFLVAGTPLPAAYDLRTKVLARTKNGARVAGH